MAKGKVYIVGAGPGDEELITIKGKRAIEEADIIFYDRLVNKQLLTYAKQQATFIYAGKKPNYHAIKQEALNELLVNHAKRGKVVTRLKGGDPFIYGRGGEEAAVLAQHHIPFEIVPGISAGIAAPAYAGIPITHRNVSNSFTVMPGHDEQVEKVNWSQYVQPNHTLVIYMGMKNLQRIVEKLLLSGQDSTMPIAIIQWGTTDTQRVVSSTLEHILSHPETKELANPAIIVIGEVVRLQHHLQWFTTSLYDDPLLELHVK
ncbi:uroporphyrinogen-III C-methyltransferase [Pseudogracilibacillus sp. ICA-222130]|uniref:uroporphyrinogen-III C-methyltransferase n=1 Tax=Pseudogracilibacillus sp. ICA-222130 TaxID=3134655 RepID=UPI0030BF33FA